MYIPPAAYQPKISDAENILKSLEQYFLFMFIGYKISQDIENDACILNYHKFTCYMIQCFCVKESFNRLSIYTLFGHNFGKILTNVIFYKKITSIYFSKIHFIEINCLKL